VGSLALMDSGTFPKHVSGIAKGLITKGDKYDPRGYFG
jgi:polyribonucleotide nucleotidyltransferase